MAVGKCSGSGVDDGGNVLGILSSFRRRKFRVKAGADRRNGRRAAWPRKSIPLRTVLRLVRQELLCQPELQRFLMLRRHFYETDADVAVVIVPDDLRLRV